MSVRIPPSAIKKQLFLFESFYPEIYAEIFLQKYGTHKEKQVNLLKYNCMLKLMCPCGWCCSARLAKAGLKLVSLSRIEFLPVIFRSSLLYISEMYSTSLKPFSAIYVVVKANINSHAFSHNSENRLFHVDPETCPSMCSKNCSRFRSTSISCKVESHSLMLLANGSTSHGKTSRSSRSLNRTFMSFSTAFSYST